MASEVKSISVFAPTRLRRASVLACTVFLLFLACVGCSVLIAAEALSGVRSASEKIPLNFEANLGQANRSVKFLSRGSGYAVFLTANEAVLALQESGARAQGSVRIQSRFKGPKLEQERSPSSVTHQRLATKDGGGALLFCGHPTLAHTVFVLGTRRPAPYFPSS